jgi:hypothetical protein
MHNRALPIFLLIALLPFAIADECTNSSLDVSANLIEPYAMINITPAHISLGNVTKGYTTDAVKINVTNLGILDISVRPVLSSNANSIFENLVFSSTSTCASNTTCIKIGDYSFDVDGSGSMGSDFDTNSFYLKLDLRNYNKTISSDQNLETNVIFWVMPRQ